MNQTTEVRKITIIQESILIKVILLGILNGILVVKATDYLPFNNWRSCCPQYIINGCTHNSVDLLSEKAVKNHYILRLKGKHLECKTNSKSSTIATQQIRQLTNWIYE